MAIAASLECGAAAPLLICGNTINSNGCTLIFISLS